MFKKGRIHAGVTIPSIFIYTHHMGQESMLKNLQQLTAECDASILYAPLAREVEYRDSSFPLKLDMNTIVVPKTKESDPFAWAETCTTQFENKKSYILIPGARFDIYGTRHGRGLGWYDRFLSKIPPTWLTIGIAYESQISASPIRRESWDVPVSFILVRHDTTWSAIQALSRD